MQQATTEASPDAQRVEGCSVCGAPLEFVNIRQTSHAIWRDEFVYVERTAICSNHHRVMRLTKTPKAGR